MSSTLFGRLRRHWSALADLKAPLMRGACEAFPCDPLGRFRARYWGPNSTSKHEGAFGPRLHRVHGTGEHVDLISKVRRTGAFL
jgi:hypothetical protein